MPSISQIKVGNTTYDIETAGGGSQQITFTLAANSWTADGNYFKQTATATGVTASTNGTVGVSQTATKTQYDAAAYAQLRCTAQAANSVTIYCYGVKPTVDIPCVIIAV